MSKLLFRQLYLKNVPDNDQQDLINPTSKLVDVDKAISANISGSPLKKLQNNLKKMQLTSSTSARNSSSGGEEANIKSDEKCACM